MKVKHKSCGWAEREVEFFCTFLGGRWLGRRAQRDPTEQIIGLGRRLFDGHKFSFMTIDDRNDTSCWSLIHGLLSSFPIHSNCAEELFDFFMCSFGEQQRKCVEKNVIFIFHHLIVVWWENGAESEGVENSNQIWEGLDREFTFRRLSLRCLYSMEDIFFCDFLPFDLCFFLAYNIHTRAVHFEHIFFAVCSFNIFSSFLVGWICHHEYIFASKIIKNNIKYK